MNVIGCRDKGHYVHIQYYKKMKLISVYCATCWVRNYFRREDDRRKESTN